MKRKWMLRVGILALFVICLAMWGRQSVQAEAYVFGERKVTAGQYTITVTFNKTNATENLYIQKRGEDKKRIHSSVNLREGIVSDGSSLYYFDGTYNEALSTSHTKLICRTLATGAEKTVMEKEAYAYLTGVKNGYLYFQMEEDHYIEGIYRFNTKTNTAARLAKGAQQLLFDGNYVYYTTFITDVSPVTLYRMKLNGKAKKTIDKMTRSAVLRDGKLYYFKNTGENTWQYKRCKKDGTAKKVLRTFTAFIPIRSTAKYIYYTVQSGTTDKYMRMNIATGKTKKVSSDEASGK